MQVNVARLGVLLFCSGTIIASAMAKTPSQLADAGHKHGSQIGQAGDPKRVSRTIEIKMNDQMRFDPPEIRVRRNEHVRLLVVNVGQVKHELVLGTMKELRDHAEEMKKHPEMEHDDPNMVSLDPGKRGEIVWRFTNVGNFVYGCLLPGHFDQGMIGKVIVSP
jgi:uncharacterized cupredoxin-like copper-binding protein